MSCPSDQRPAAPVPPSLSTRRRWRWIVISALLVAAATGGVWRYRVSRPEYRFDRGLQAVARRDWHTADELADRLSATGHPDEAHILRAESLFARKDSAGALDECNRVRPDGGSLHLRAAVLSGKCLLDLAEPTEAVRVFAFVVSREPDNVDAHRGWAAAAYDLGQTSQAIAELRQVARLDPADYRPHRLAGDIHRDAGDWNRAEAEYREAVRLGGGPPSVRAQVRADLARTLVEAAKFSEALDVLDDGGEGDPESRPAALARAEALRGLGRYDEAAALVDRELEARPDGQLYRVRGQLHLDRGEWAAAIPPLEEATRRIRAPYQAYLLLAQAYGLAGRKADAAKALARAEQLRRDAQAASELSREANARPWDPAVRLRLAAVFDRLGDPDLAAMWRRAAASVAGRR